MAITKKGILLVNLGTPDAPTYNGLRTYLSQFLTDRRVIDLPWLFRKILEYDAPLLVYQVAWDDTTTLYQPYIIYRKTGNDTGTVPA